MGSCIFFGIRSRIQIVSDASNINVYSIYIYWKSNFDYSVSDMVRILNVWILIWIAHVVFKSFRDRWKSGISILFSSLVVTLLVALAL